MRGQPPMVGCCTTASRRLGVMRVPRRTSASARRPTSRRRCRWSVIRPGSGSSSATERKAWLRMLEAELEDGALGIGVLAGYAPRSEPDEFLDVACLAARTGTATFTHVRENVESDPTTPIDGSLEITRA